MPIYVDKNRYMNKWLGSPEFTGDFWWDDL